ncbi:MAG: metalloregulator ArsR/SmtB family transcription factor [Armatimonadota bacterium]|nr:metalloregulator ArsR/SmtB family transcription factor [Armatimonadota bacterium]MDR7549956.1 metalloregulator ArsR/SmtB family transcription factor [Armatimonadota bacterium]
MLAPARRCCATDCASVIARTAFHEADITARAASLTALADPTRLTIVELLARHESLCVCEIQQAFDLSQPTVSHHLKILRDAGLVDVERRGTWAYYSLRRDGIKDLLQDLVSLVRRDGWRGSRC